MLMICVVRWWVEEVGNWFRCVVGWWVLLLGVNYMMVGWYVVL